VLERARELGVDWLDTAAPYGTAPGDGERLLAPFARDFRVATKGGLVRRGRRWEPDGRAGRLVASAEASRARLGVEALDAFLLHAPDPRTAFRTTVRALARIEERGIAREVGVCNVTVGQLREALDHAPIRWVQVPFSPWDASSVRSGILEVCLELGIPVMAHRPLGGAERLSRRLQRYPALDGNPAELVLAWIASLGFVPLPGPSRVETLESCVRALAVPLDDGVRSVLDATFVPGGRLRTRRAERAPSPDHPHEVRIVMGSPGAGKTTAAQRFVEAGHARLNRDDRGGTLRGLLRPLDAMLAEGSRSVVLDNTYPSRAQRYDVIETAWSHGVPVRITVVDTPPADCERNAIERILDRLGRLPEPDEFDASDPAILPPRALLGFRNKLEPPQLDEGFVEIERLAFVRKPADGDRALIVDPAALDDPANLERAADAGWRVLVVGWQEGLSPDEAVEAAKAIEARRGFVHAAICGHAGGPPVCWCRKPWLGLPVVLARAHGVDLARSVVVVGSRSDRTMADKLGIPAIEGHEVMSLLHRGRR